MLFPSGLSEMAWLSLFLGLFQFFLLGCSPANFSWEEEQQLSNWQAANLP